MDVLKNNNYRLKNIRDTVAVIIENPRVLSFEMR